jgi:hypothetical protein
MNPSIRPSEMRLLTACLALGLLACLAPPLAQAQHYHAFADQRSWLGVPFAMDVLSNLAFAAFGLAGLSRLWRLPAPTPGDAQRPLAALFFGGLLLTAVCSAWYHWQPDDAGLAVDRCGMVLAFAGLLGLAAAGSISDRAGVLLALGLLVLGPLSVWAWSVSGNVLPWGVLQFGGMALLLVLAWLKPLPGALAVRWGVVILIYVAAKVLEQADQVLYALSGQLVSGHSLKHVVAALAGWPVIAALGELGQNASDTLQSWREPDSSRGQP